MILSLAGKMVGRQRIRARRWAGVAVGVLMVLGWIGIAGSAWPADGPGPLGAFKPGERLTYVLKWTFIPAGEAVLEVLPPEKLAGTDACHFVLTARSNAFVDAFFMVRDRIDAWADAAMQRSLRYQKKQHEGATQRRITVLFDWQAMTARAIDQGKVREPVPIEEGTFDPLSIFYWSRSTDWVVGGRIQRPVTDGKKFVMGRADVVRRETVTVPAGSFDTFLIEPDLEHVGGVFEKSPQASIQLWVTADERRVPVKLKSRVIVGSFSGELVRMEGVVPPAPPMPSVE